MCISRTEPSLGSGFHGVFAEKCAPGIVPRDTVNYEMVRFLELLQSLFSIRSEVSGRSFEVTEALEFLLQRRYGVTGFAAAKKRVSGGR